MPPRDSQDIPFESLELDPLNPRLPNSVERTQRKILEYIARETSIEELMAVIAENGFFQGEALIAYPTPKSKDRFTVIEGNRRLTAVRLLHDPDLYPKRRRIREIADEAKHKPTTLPVIVYEKRNEVLTYLGYRHITGVKQWDPLAKARYMLQLFEQTDPQKNADDRYRDVANAIGSRRDHIKRSLDALAVYNAIADADFFEIEGFDESTIEFSLLSTALAYPSISKFMGADSYPIMAPASIKRDNLHAFARWLYEKKSGGETVIGESRNIKKLAAIAENDRALDALTKGTTLDAAYRLTSGVKDELVTHLYEAQASLQASNSFVALVKPDEALVDTARDVSKLAKNVLRSLEDARED